MAQARSAPSPDRDEQICAVLHAIDKLPDRQRDVLVLSALEGLSHEQVAQVLDISAGAVKASLSLARKRVAEQLSQHEPELPSAETAR